MLRDMPHNTGKISLTSDQLGSLSRYVHITPLESTLNQLLIVR